MRNTMEKMKNKRVDNLIMSVMRIVKRQKVIVYLKTKKMKKRMMSNHRKMIA